MNQCDWRHKHKAQDYKKKNKRWRSHKTSATRNLHQSTQKSDIIKPFRTNGLYDSETQAHNIKGQPEELKKEERKIIRKIFRLEKIEEGYRLQTKNTIEKHSYNEIYIRK